MNVLAFDTAMGACSVAILKSGNLVAHHFEEQPRGHAETLVPAIESCFRCAKLEMSVIDRVGVTAGPGTFTGIRVGLATARALVLGTRARIGSVCTLQVLAKGLTQSIGSKVRSPRSVLVPVCDARRGEVYLQVFDGQAQPLSEPMVLPVKSAGEHVEALAKADDRVLYFGSGADLISPYLAGREALKYETGHPVHPDAKNLASLVLEMQDAELGIPSPIYLRPPDAKLPGSK